MSYWVYLIATSYAESALPTRLHHGMLILCTFCKCPTCCAVTTAEDVKMK